jgi:hypothetical protein
MNIAPSKAIISAAFHRSGQLAAIAEAAAAAKETEDKNTKEEPLQKQQLLKAAASNRPSAETEESIRKQWSKKIKAECIRQSGVS